MTSWGSVSWSWSGWGWGRSRGWRRLEPWWGCWSWPNYCTIVYHQISWLIRCFFDLDTLYYFTELVCDGGIFNTWYFSTKKHLYVCFPYLFRSMQRGRRLVKRALASKLVPVRSVARSSRCEVFIFLTIKIVTRPSVMCVTHQMSLKKLAQLCVTRWWIINSFWLLLGSTVLGQYMAILVGNWW